jgi:hypothetical protein
MRTVLVFAIVGLALGVMGCEVWNGIVGGSGSAEMKRLAEENAALAAQIEETVKEVKSGAKSPLEAMLTLNRLKLQVDANLEQIKKIQAEGQSTGYVIGTIIGLVGRTALHGVAAKFPMLAPWLTMLLGGSETKKSPAPTAPLQTSAPPS